MDQEELQAAAHQRDVDAIIEQGRERYGDGRFDEICNDVVRAIGGDPTALTVTLKQFDHPTEILAHLADNPDRLHKLSHMPAARQLAELAAIQNQVAGTPGGVAALAISRHGLRQKHMASVREVRIFRIRPRATPRGTERLISTRSSARRIGAGDETGPG